MSQIKGTLYFFGTGARYNFTIFWSILLGTMLISLTIAFFISDMMGDTRMVFAVSMPAYIYGSIVGYATVKESIPHLLKLGATRKNIFLGLGLSFLGLSIVMAVLVSVVHVLFTWLTETFNIGGYELLHAAQVFDDTFLNRVLIDASVMFFILASMFLLGLLFYKYGLLGGGIVVGVLVVLFLVGLATSWIPDAVKSLYEHRALMQFVWLFTIGAVLYSLVWTMIRRITIVKTR
ncbi:hypothetical protein JNUCC1_02550 [Lentibacillus sp. JNUCC-1]|uniref:hypothetical protein n=1 Tax=Lentibacillus sp. JNUCC-1 TaxID=2654513 RepID=UPI0012E82069|nr:hypothetical protein [Lentibacillus sp. JNUCC-1]MUV38696.1 hypothetical protein [Lentibacillus sp. JNUCC-1]